MLFATPSMPGTALFADGKFHNTGAGINGAGDFTDVGRFGQTKREADKGEFKTPTLRNVALTAPYMHDGSLKTLKDVVDFYVGGGNSNPDLDKEMKPLHLSAQDRADLVTFLESLTGECLRTPSTWGAIGRYETCSLSPSLLRRRDAFRLL